jgi:branched-chain amino acid transport system ATP-binding protein
MSETAPRQFPAGAAEVSGGTEVGDGDLEGAPALEIEKVSYRYDALEALRGVSLRVSQGEAVAVVGVNGAGKSTLLRVAAGLLRATTGSHRAFGEPLDGTGLRGHMRRGVVLVPEGRPVIAPLSVADNVLLGGSCRGWRRPSAEAMAFAYDVFPELAAIREHRAGALSGGQQQMLAIGRALVARPRLLLLDEPSQGLAPFVQERLTRSFSQLRAAGITLVIVEQNLSFAQQCTGRLYAIAQGVVRFSGVWAGFTSDENLLASYL